MINYNFSPLDLDVAREMYSACNDSEYHFDHFPSVKKEWCWRAYSMRKELERKGYFIGKKE